MAETPRLISAEILRTNSSKELLAGPEKPEDLSVWLGGMQVYRGEMQALLKDSVAS